MPLCDIPPMHGAPPVSLHYVVEGRGPRRILFVMGLGATLDGWMFQHAHFGKRHPDKYTVCVFDNRGIGESDYNSTVNSTSIMANDALALLNHLGWHSDVHLVGISMGGMISMEAASRAPEVFASLTLVNTHAGEWRPTPLATSALFLRSMTAKDTTSRLEALFRLLHSHRLDPKGQRGKAIIEALRMRIAKGRPSRFGFLGQLGAVFRHSVSARRLAALKATGLPVLICVGTDDILVRPQRSHDLHRHLGGVLRVFDGVGHALVSEAHDTFNTVLEDHVRAHDPADVHGVRPVARVPNFDTLPAIDSLFLMMESPENSMSIAGVSMFDSKDAPSHAELITLLHKWTHQFPRLRQRVINWQADASSSASGPLSWVDDPTFDITRHVKVISVTPESRLTVQEAIGRELSRPLLRDRPLWNAVLFDGVPLAGVTAADGKTVYGAEARGTALFIQLHHAIADGGLSVHMILALCQDSSTAASSAAASASGTTSTHPHKADSADNFGSTAPLAVHLQKHDPHQPITRADPALVSRTSAAESHARVVEPKMQRKRHYAQLPALRSLYLLASSVWALLIGIIAWLVSAVGVGIKMLGVNRLGQSPLLYMDGTPRSNASLSSVIATSQQRLNAALDWLSRGESVWSVMNALRGHSGVDVLRRLSQHAQFARPETDSFAFELAGHDADYRDSIAYPDEAKWVAWTKPLNLVEVKRIGRAFGVTVNDVLVACAAGAFNRAFQMSHPGAIPAELPVLIPFNMRSRLSSPFSTAAIPNEAGVAASANRHAFAKAASSSPKKGASAIKMGNQSTMVWSSLATGSNWTAAARLSETRRRMDLLKQSAEPMLAWLTVALVGLMPTAISKWLVGFYGDKAAAVITNVPGPQLPLTIGGHRLLSYTGFIPTPGAKGVGLTIFSYNGSVSVSMTGSCRLKPSVATLTGAFEDEFAALTRAANDVR